MLRDRLFATRRRREPEAEGGFDARRRPGWPPGEVAGWLAEHAPVGSAPACTWWAPGAAAPATPEALALATPRRSRGVRRRCRRSTREDEARAGRLAGRPGRGPRRCTTPRGRCTALRARGLPLRGRGQRHRPVGLPRAARPALLRPGRPRPAPPRRELRIGGRGGRAGSSRFDTGDDTGRGRAAMVRARAVLDLADVARPASWTAAAAPSCCATSSCRWCEVLADDGARPASRVDADQLADLESEFAGAVQRGRTTTAYDGDRPGDQPRLAQAAAGGAVRRARHAEDQAHEDRLHHRRGRADRPVRQDRAPVPARHLLRHRDVSRLRQTVEGLLKTVADDGRIHTTYNQTDRGDRPAVSSPTRTCRTSRSAPRRAAGSARRSSSGAGYELAADRRLQPDRDADHGAPVRGRRPDRGVQHRRGPAPVRRGPGVRRRAGGRDRRRCAPRSRR